MPLKVPNRLVQGVSCHGSAGFSHQITVMLDSSSVNPGKKLNCYARQ